MEIAEGIWVVKKLFSVKRCREWIDRCEKLGFDDAPISVSVGKELVRKDIRNNSRAMIDDKDLAFEIWQQAKEHLPKMIYGRVALG